MLFFIFSCLSQIHTLVWLWNQIFDNVHTKWKTTQKPLSTQSLQRIPVSQILFKARPSDDDFVCVYSQFDPQKSCGNRPSKDDAKIATYTLYPIIEMNPPKRKGVEQVLDHFARYCLCHKHRQELTTSYADFWNQQILSWIQELHKLYSQGASNFETRPYPEESSRLTAELTAPSEFVDQRGIRQSTPVLPGGFPSSQSSVDYSDGVRGPTGGHCDESELETLERYRNHFNHTSDDSLENTSSEKRFVSVKGRGSLFRQITQQLSPADSRPGTVYLYQSERDREATDLDYVKIGYTNAEVEDRLYQIESKCKVKCSDSREFPTINAKRVESLVHRELELMGKRRKDRRCFNNSNGFKSSCATIHGEWFEIGRKEAIKVIKYWVKWMEYHDPYNDEGFLKQESVVLMYSSSLVENARAKLADAHKEFVFDSQAKRWLLLDRIDQAPSPSSKRDRQDATSQISPQPLESEIPVLSIEEMYEDNIPTAPPRHTKSKQNQVPSPRMKQALSRASLTSNDDDEETEVCGRKSTGPLTPSANLKSRMRLPKSYSEPSKPTGGLQQSPDHSESPTPHQRSNSSRSTKNRRRSDIESFASSSRRADKARSDRKSSAPDLKPVETPVRWSDDEDEDEDETRL